MVPLVLAVETAFAPAYWIHAALWLPLTLALAFGLMHPIKGAVIAWQWAARMHGFDPDAPPEDIECRRSRLQKAVLHELIFPSKMTAVERDRSSPNVRPKDASTLIIVDRSGTTPKVLLGKRHHGHKFMPGKFVFPGGRLEPT